MRELWKSIEGYEGYRFDETMVLYGMPIRIEYEKTNTIELWKKVS